MKIDIDELMGNLKPKIDKCISDLKIFWSGLEPENKRKIIIGIVLMAVILFAYAVKSHGEVQNETKVLVSRESEFKKDRILGDPYATLGAKRESQRAAARQDYSENQKAVTDAIGKIDSRLGLIEAKLQNQSETGGPVPGTGSATSAADGSHSADNHSENASPIADQNSTPTTDPHGVAGGRIVNRSTRMPAVYTPTRGPALLSFPVPGASSTTRAEVALPVGSFVKAKLLTGVEAPEGAPYPVLLQLDFAHILPNNKTLDLRGCFMIAKAQGDLSTERVQMQATKLSCVARSGKMFERDINGFVADAKDNSFAVVGSVNTKQDRVAGMAFLSAIVEGISKAIQMAQTSEVTSSDGSSRRVLTGDQGKYIAAGGAGQAGSMVAQWYLKQAQSLLPTINVGSGQDLWIVMNETVGLPEDYFKKLTTGDANASDQFISRLFD